MRFRYRVLSDDAGGASGGGGAGSGASEKTYTEAEFAAKVSEWETERKALLAKRDEALGEAKTAKGRLRELEQAASASKAGITEEQLKQIRADIAADYEKRYSEYKTQAESLAAENRSLKLDTKVKAMMAESGVRSERIESLFRLTSEQWDLTEDGKPVVKDRMGFEPKKFIAEELSKQYPEWFQGSGSSGGGAVRSNAGGGGAIRSIAINDPASVFAPGALEAMAKGQATIR